MSDEWKIGEQLGIFKAEVDGKFQIMDAKFEVMAEREWVKDLFNTLNENLVEIKQVFKSVTVTQDRLLVEEADRKAEKHQAEMRAIQDKKDADMRALQEKKDAEIAALRDKVLLNVIKEKWAPVAGFLATLITVCAFLGALFVWWVQHYAR